MEAQEEMTIGSRRPPLLKVLAITVTAPFVLIGWGSLPLTFVSLSPGWEPKPLASEICYRVWPLLILCALLARAISKRTHVAPLFVFAAFLVAMMAGLALKWGLLSHVFNAGGMLWLLGVVGLARRGTNWILDWALAAAGSVTAIVAVSLKP